MKTFVNTISDFCCKHRKFSVTIILFIIVNCCFHGGSKVNQDNLSKLFGVEFPPCRAAKEIGQFNNGGEEWQFTGKLIFKTMPTEEFYLSLDKTPRPKGYTYKFITPDADDSKVVKSILGIDGYLKLYIEKGDSIASYYYGNY